MMGTPNRRDFLRKTAIGSVSVAAGLTTAGLFPRRIPAEEGSGFNRVFYRQLGSTGFKVSEIGFGAMNMRDAELVHAAIDKGINYIDTAYGYMRGVNEEVIGQVMKTKRDRVFLTTKVPVRRGTNNLISMMETSLKRLQTDHVDLMLMHGGGGRDRVLNDDYIKVFDDAKKKGICRFVGISTHSNQQEILNAMIDSKFWEAALVGYNYMTPPGVKASIEKARKSGIAIIAMKNLLTSAWPPEPLEDMRTDKSVRITKAQAMIKWVLQDPYVDTTIPGMTAFEHIDEDMAVMGMKLSYDDRRTLHRYGKRIGNRYCRGVAGCTECLDQCPKGVQVSELNRCLGYAYGYGNLALAWENYKELPKSSRVDVCKDCTECVVKCVHGLDLTHNIQQAKELFA